MASQSNAAVFEVVSMLIWSDASDWRSAFFRTERKKETSLSAVEIYYRSATLYSWILISISDFSCHFGMHGEQKRRWIDNKFSSSCARFFHNKSSLSRLLRSNLLVFRWRMKTNWSLFFFLFALVSLCFIFGSLSFSQFFSHAQSEIFLFFVRKWRMQTEKR